MKLIALKKSRYHATHKNLNMSIPFFGLEQMSEVYNVDKDWLFDKLLKELNAHRNLLLLGERALGLQEYVDELGFLLADNNPDIHVCRIDLKQAHDPDSFLELFVKTLSNKFPEVTGSLMKDLRQTDVLKLPSMIAHRKKIRVALFLANTHLFNRFRDRVSFLRLLRLKFKNQRNCIFCMYGYNNQHLRDLVQHPGPLSGLGQVFQLKQNPTKDRTASIRKIFHIHDKNIGYSTSVQMSYMVDNHPFYLKLLVWHALIRTRHTCTMKIIEYAMNDLIHHFDYHFRMIEDSLTEKQIRFLKALLEGNQKLYSKSLREKYQLGPTSTIARIKVSLIKKEIIHIGIGDISHKDIFFMDPVFREWFRKRYGTPD